MFGLRMPELLVIFAILLLVFGANRIPQLGRSLGETMRGFRKAVEKEPEDVTPAAPAQRAKLAAAVAAGEPEGATADKGSAASK